MSDWADTAKLRQEISDAWHLADLRKAEAEQLRAELAASREREARMKQDAERYRWLRDVSVPPHNFYLSVPDEFAGVRYTPTEVDAAIDAAIDALRGEEK